MNSSFFYKWWSPFLTHALLFAGFVVGLPYLLHKIYAWHALTLSLVGVLSVTGLAILAIAHVGSMGIAVLVSMGIGFWAVLTWPREPLGNWHLQLADHILFWILLGFGIAAAFESHELNKSAKLGRSTLS